MGIALTSFNHELVVIMLTCEMTSKVSHCIVCNRNYDILLQPEYEEVQGSSLSALVYFNAVD